jgi:FkbM family methyltransferase
MRLLKLTETFGLFGAIKVIFSHLFKKGLVNVNLPQFKNKIRFRPYTGDFATIRQVIWDKEYDLKLSWNPGVIVDLGANIGISTMAFASQYPDAKIIAIEPDKKNFEILGFNTKKYKNIISVNKAIWINDEMVSLENPVGLSNSYIFKKSNIEKNENTIQAISINTLMDEFNILNINLLKVDIEGVEKEIFLQGNNNWIEKVDVISIEFHDNVVAGDISKLLISMNFDESEIGEKKIFRNLNSG